MRGVVKLFALWALIGALLPACAQTEKPQRFNEIARLAVEKPPLPDDFASYWRIENVCGDLTVRYHEGGPLVLAVLDERAYVLPEYGITEYRLGDPVAYIASKRGTDTRDMVYVRDGEAWRSHVLRGTLDERTDTANQLISNTIAALGGNDVELVRDDCESQVHDQYVLLTKAAFQHMEFR